MIKRAIMIGICTVSPAFIIGCTAESTNVTDITDISKPTIEIDMKNAEEQVEMIESYTYEDYERVFEEVLKEAESYSLEDEELEKWFIRTLSQEKMYFETDLTQEEVLQLAEWDMRKDEAWKELATEKYGVTFTDEEIDNHLNEFTPALKKGSSKDQLQAYADTLGFTLKELLYEYDRDYAVKMVVWEKLTPILTEEYESADHDVLVEKYLDEVENKLESIATN